MPDAATLDRGGAPLATYTGWALRAGPQANDGCESSGQFIPFPALLPFVDVMVTNGGYGGVQMALSAGVPLVVAGQTEDKTEVSARVGWAGVGINLKTNTARSADVRAAVRKVLGSDSYRRRATALAEEFARYDSTALQTQAILDLVGTRHGGLRSAAAVTV